MSILRPNTDKIQNFRDRGLFLMAWRLSLIFSALFLSLSISFSFYSIAAALTYLPIATLSIISLFYLNKTHNPKPVFWLIAIAGAGISQLTLYLLPQTLPYSNFTWVLAGVVFSYVAISRKVGVYFLILNSIGFVIYFFVGLEHHLNSVEPLTLTAKINIAFEVTASLLIVGYLLNQYQIYQTYTRLQLRKLNLHLEQQNDTVLAKNKENITLVKEIHHRVKNNLQIIISLLRMQRSQVESDENKRHFDDMINRVMTMSMIHQRLYQEKEASRINIKEYLEELTAEILSLSSNENQVQFKIKSTIQFIDLKTTVPLGLLINELISNSVKHAFSSDQENCISITMNDLSDGFRLSYADSGEWVEKVRESDSYGIELIDVLTEQLNGTYSREDSTYVFQFKPDED